ncbi:PIG-L family deacetylase [Chryseomicrobium palamuruense]
MKQLLFSVAGSLAKIPNSVIARTFYSGNKTTDSVESKSNILVFVPHADDETIGLGGTICAHKEKGCTISVVNVTDGAGSAKAIEGLAEKRKEELRQVQNLFGIDSLDFLDLPDGQVSTSSAESVFAHYIDLLKPTVIYTTSFIDAHVDHVGTAQLLARALPLSSWKPDIIREYEINCPVPPEEINTIFEVSDYQSVKEKAIDVFSSQAIAFEGFVDLSQYKAALVGKSTGYYETFVTHTPEDFMKKAAWVAANTDGQFGTLFKQLNRRATILWALTKNVDKKRALYKRSREEQIQ